MNTKNISNLILKIAGIVILILSIPNIHYYVLIYSQFKVKTISLFLTTVIAPNIIPILLGVFFFTKPDKVTNKIVQDSDSTLKDCDSNTFNQLEQLCLSVIGYYILAKSSAEIIFQIANFVQAKASIPYQSGKPSNSLIFTAEFITLIAELFLAFWLIFGAKGIVELVNKIRSKK